MVIIRATEFGERLKGLFSEAGGSNFCEHAPLSFKAKGQKGTIDPNKLREQYIELFQDIASLTLGKPYTHGIAPVPGINEFGNPVDGGKLVIHTVGVKLIEANHQYYFNQWAFSYEGGDDFPLIKLEPFDFRKPRHDEEKSYVSLKFNYGTLKNRHKLFTAFEKAIGSSGMPYERHHSERGLESLDFDFTFEQVASSRP